MTLSHGRDLFMTPGPSVIPDRVLNAMHRAAPNIYEGDLIARVDEILVNLRKIARTTCAPSIYICNGHGVWEAALHNVIAPGEKVLCLATGRFGNGWAAVAEQLGAEVEFIDFGTNSSFDLSQVEDALRADKSHKIKAVMATHTDTSTSIRNDIAKLRATLDIANHPALLMVDCIASLGCEEFEMDEWGVDVMVAACQKGLMTPPGIAFTFHNEKADAVSQKIKKTSPYWDWEPRTKGTVFYQKFGGTAPTHHLFGLHEALSMIDEEGIENVWARHEKQAHAIRAAGEKWAEAGAVQFNVPKMADRSFAVTTFVTQSENLTALRKWCEVEGGLTLGVGLALVGPAGDDVFRIGHMGHMNPTMLMGALATVDAGLKALNIPHGDGALDAASRALFS